MTHHQLQRSNRGSSVPRRSGIEDPHGLTGIEGEKGRRSLHQRVLDRVRAEYKIRKIRRFVRKAVEFVPSKILGWLKTVRASLNLRFRKGSSPEPGVFSEHVGLRIMNVPPLNKEKSITSWEDPFPLWWAWKAFDSTGHIWLSLDSVNDASPSPLTEREKFSPHLRRAYNLERVKILGPWTRPPALGGPIIKVIPCNCELGCGRSTTTPLRIQFRVRADPLYPKPSHRCGQSCRLETTILNPGHRDYRWARWKIGAPKGFSYPILQDFLSCDTGGSKATLHGLQQY